MSDAPGADWAFESIFHFTVNATDFERSLAFYRTLGFRLLRDNRDVVWPDFVAGNFGMERAQGRWTDRPHLPRGRLRSCRAAAVGRCTCPRLPR